MIDFSKFKGAIFDIDGTLIDSMWKWHDVEDEYARALGLETGASLKEIMRPLSLVEVADYFKNVLGVEKTEQQITDEKNLLMEPGYFNEFQLKPGVVELLEFLKGRGYKMCTATATDKYLVDAAMERLDIRKYFSKTFTCTDENTSKTVPDIFVTAAEFLGTDVSETIVFEDALHAIASAKKAGFTVVGLDDESTRDQKQEIMKLCDYYYETIEDII